VLLGERPCRPHRMGTTVRKGKYPRRRLSHGDIIAGAFLFIATATAIYSLGHRLYAPSLQCLGRLSFPTFVGR